MNPATFKYGFTLPIIGAHKLRRFVDWVTEHAPDVAYRLPPQAPIDTETLTVRLRSQADKERLTALLPATLP